MSELVSIILLNVVVIAAMFALFWAVCVAMRDCTPVDSLWALGMAVVAVATFIYTGGGTERRIALTAICVVWAVRLGGYLLWRWRDHGPDRRYVRMMEKAKQDKGWGYGYAAFRLVFLLQMPLLWLVCLPVQLGQIPAGPGTLGILGWIGVGVSVFGIGFESLADWQLVRFKKNPATAGQVMDKGLWRYTRHPNYFGDACVWWGLFLIAAETPLGLLSVVGPIYLVFTLTRWSGIPTVEYRLKKTRPAYADYARRTSGFLPWPPKPPQAD